MSFPTKMKAEHIKHGYWIDGKRVRWATPDYLRPGKIEVHYWTGETVFYDYDEILQVAT